MVGNIWQILIPYNGKVCRIWQIVHDLPSKLVFTINNQLADVLICQTFFHQMLKESICQTFMLYGINKTVCAYVINIVLKVHENIQCLKWSALTGARPRFYMCVIKCAVISVFESTINEATTSSYQDMWKVKARGRLAITLILMLLSPNLLLVNDFTDILKDKNNKNLTIQALIQSQSYKSKHI